MFFQAIMQKPCKTGKQGFWGVKSPEIYPFSFILINRSPFVFLAITVKTVFLLRIAAYLQLCLFTAIHAAESDIHRFSIRILAIEFHAVTVWTPVPFP